MAQLPAVYTIQASDTTEHANKLKEILQNLKTENRIGDFKTLDADGELSSLSQMIQEGDLILVLLTQRLDSKREEIETYLLELKSGTPGIRIGEIIVDQIPYENEFITFPTDLRPIRDRDDMDAVWDGIKESLRDMFPAKKEPDPVVPPTTGWSKYLKIAGIIIGVILVFFLIRGLWSGDNGGTAQRVPADVEEPRPEDEEEIRPSVLQGEDCLSFNPQNVRVQQQGNQFLLTDGNSRMMLFDTRQGANMALRIIRNYQLDSHCFATRPNPGLKYFKTNGDIPTGSFSGEDCIRISNPQNLTIRGSGNLFQVLDNNSIPYAARSREEAERIVEIVQHYDAGFTCYVERPDPPMVYLRK